jgi:hypothetical protein
MFCINSLRSINMHYHQSFRSSRNQLIWKFDINESNMLMNQICLNCLWLSSMWNFQTSNLRFAKHVFLISNIEFIILARSLINRKFSKNVFIQISSKETTFYLLWKEHKYEIVVINNATLIKFSLILKNKDDICSVVISVFNKMKNQIDRKIKFFRTDDEKKFKDLISELNARDIQWKKSASYAQDQNDVSERSIKTILERVRTFMIHAHLFRKFWFEALIAACYIINRLLIKSLRRMNLYEAWYEKKSDLSSLRVYDCDVYVIDYQAKFNDKMTSSLICRV